MCCELRSSPDAFATLDRITCKGTPRRGSDNTPAPHHVQSPTKGAKAAGDQSCTRFWFKCLLTCGVVMGKPYTQLIHAHAHMHTHTHTTHTCTRTRTRARTHTHTHRRAHAYTRTHTHTRAYTHAHTHVHARAKAHTRGVYTALGCVHTPWLGQRRVCTARATNHTPFPTLQDGGQFFNYFY